MERKIWKKAIGAISDYVYQNNGNNNKFNALVLPNKIVLRCYLDKVEIWDNDRYFKEGYFSNPESTVNFVLYKIEEWYEADICQKVWKGKSFIMPNGKSYKTSVLNVPVDECGYPTLEDKEIYKSFVEKYKCEGEIWSYDEAEELFNSILNE